MFAYWVLLFVNLGLGNSFLLLGLVIVLRSI